MVISSMYAMSLNIRMAQTYGEGIGYDQGSKNEIIDGWMDWFRLIYLLCSLPNFSGAMYLPSQIVDALYPYDLLGVESVFSIPAIITNNSLMQVDRRSLYLLLDHQVYIRHGAARRIQG